MSSPTPTPRDFHGGTRARPGGTDGPMTNRSAGPEPDTESASQSAPNGASGGEWAPPEWAPPEWAHARILTLEPELSAPRRVKSLVALGVTVVIAALGFLLGWVWSSLAPWLPGVIHSDGLYLQQPYGEQRAGQETWFILLSIGLGIVVAIVVWTALRRFRGPLMVVALAVGGIAAGWIGWRFGHNIGRGHALFDARHGRIGQVVLIPPDLRIKQPGNIALWHGWLPYLSGVLLYTAIAAIVTYLIIAGFTANPGLVGPRRHRPADLATPATVPPAE